MWTVKEAEDFWKSIVRDKIDEIAELEAENKRMRQALEFYADLSNYNANETCCDGLPHIDNDTGDRARQALGERNI